MQIFSRFAFLFMDIQFIMIVFFFFNQELFMDTQFVVIIVYPKMQSLELQFCVGGSNFSHNLFAFTNSNFTVFSGLSKNLELCVFLYWSCIDLLVFHVSFRLYTEVQLLKDDYLSSFVQGFVMVLQVLGVAGCLVSCIVQFTIHTKVL